MLTEKPQPPPLLPLLQFSEPPPLFSLFQWKGKRERENARTLFRDFLAFSLRITSFTTLFLMARFGNKDISQNAFQVTQFPALAFIVWNTLWNNSFFHSTYNEFLYGFCGGFLSPRKKTLPKSHFFFHRDEKNGFFFPVVKKNGFFFPIRKIFP